MPMMPILGLVLSNRVTSGENNTYSVPGMGAYVR
jgi:hypothetical protein